MCGIYCSIGRYQFNWNEDKKQSLVEEEHQNLLLRRGPDSYKAIEISNVTFKGSVLWHQGDEVCAQPFENNDSVLLFNGDIFAIAHTKPLHISDTAWMAEILCNCKNDDDLMSIFRTLEGPFSLIYFNKRTKDIYFGRDCFGRHSLIVETNDNYLRILSTSYFTKEEQTCIMELPPFGLFKFNILSPDVWTIYPWFPIDSDECINHLSELETCFKIKIIKKDVIGPTWLHINHNVKESFDFHDMFRYLQLQEPGEIFHGLLSNNALLHELKTFSLLLEKSVKERVCSTSIYCKNCVLGRQSCYHSKIIILFSGGIDCSILAVLADKYVNKDDSIDLINVAFESSKPCGSTWETPDKISANSSFAELQELCPSRKWNFIEANISRHELHMILDTHIKHLIYPRDTILDESIGSAFWFASRGKGVCNKELYTSPARVALIGTGADELFGGYVRYKNTYNRCPGNEEEKQQILHNELEMDWRRLPQRNLGRDDRVIADNGMTSRAPFLEEHLVEYVRNLTPNQRCCFLYKDGVGDKLFLRLYGFQIGLRYPVFLKKRAIQFGSRIANKKQNAKNRSDYFKF